MINDIELNRLKCEIDKLRKEKAIREEIRNAKLELLREKVVAAPDKFKSNHPILTFLAAHGYNGSKVVAKEGLHMVKEGANGAKEAGKVLWHGVREFAKYAAEKKADQYEREGKILEAEQLRNRVRRMRA